MSGPTRGGGPRAATGGAGRPAKAAPRRPARARDGARSQPPDGPGLDHLWAPWRMEYIDAAMRSSRRRASAKGQTGASVPEECLFCRVAASRDDRSDLVLRRSGEALLMLNRFPYNPAHLMVAVRRHVARIADLTPAERQDLLELTAVAERAVEAEYRPHGMNLGLNLGRVAGAGFPGHLHLHLVPRWDGDTNFMPVIGATRVLPESLTRTWTRLRRALEAAPAAAAGRANAGPAAPGARRSARAR